MTCDCLLKVDPVICAFDLLEKNITFLGLSYLLTANFYEPVSFCDVINLVIFYLQK